jgi:hypothetical protein
VLNRKQRQIETLQRRLATAIERRDEAIKERDSANYVNGRLARDLVNGATAASRALSEATDDASHAEGLLSRAVRLLRRREERHRGIVGALRRDLAVARAKAIIQKERADKLDARLQALEQANRDFDWRYGIYPKAAEAPATAA